MFYMFTILVHLNKKVLFYFLEHSIQCKFHTAIHIYDHEQSQAKPQQTGHSNDHQTSDANKLTQENKRRK